MRDVKSESCAGVITMREVLCVALGSLGLLLVYVEAGLQAGEKKCGQLTCQDKQFCDDHSNLCEPCNKVCDTHSNNYQESVCNVQCQDYLHEMKYVTREETNSVDDINSKVARLTVLVSVTLVVVMLVFLLLVAALAFILWLRSQQQQQQPSLLFKSPPVDGGVKMNGLKIDMPATPTTAPPPVTPATTSTPLSTRPRYPKEDTTLEYGAYDNPALTPSPVFDNKQDSAAPTPTPVTRRQESSF